MGKIAKIKPVIGMQVMDGRGTICEVIDVSEDGSIVTERNTATGNEFNFPVPLLGFYMCWVP